MITELMREAVARVSKLQRRQEVVRCILARRADAPAVSAAEMERLRHEGRP